MSDKKTPSGRSIRSTRKNKALFYPTPNLCLFFGILIAPIKEETESDDKYPHNPPGPALLIDTGDS